MAVKELREAYGNAKTWQAMNRAIRAEVPGGDELLDAIGLAAPLRDRSPQCAKLFEKLQQAREAMNAFIAQKYELKSATEGAKNE
ncbi:MAG: hypothetical protein J6K20_11335 [Thermoguttaceae bacterium]|nr:hypothetical protein [Thermoguttaceae bacterium]